MAYLWRVLGVVLDIIEEAAGFDLALGPGTLHSPIWAVLADRDLLMVEVLLRLACDS